MTLRSVSKILCQAIREWSDDNAPRLGAALAFYACFAVAPLLVLSTAAAGLIFGHDAARGRLLEQVREFVGDDAGSALQAMVVSAAEPKTSLWATMAGIGAMLIGAVGLFSELQAALNTIWNVRPRADRGWLGKVRDRFVSFVMLLITAGILLALLIGSAVVAAINAQLEGMRLVFIFGPVAQTVLTFSVLTLLIAFVYKWLPDVVIAWSDVWLGAVVTALLFTAGNYAIGVYLSYSALRSAYGAAGSLVVLLAWMYYSTMVFLAGAEITQVYAKWHGSGIHPTGHAEHLGDKPGAARTPQ